jgi:hypothetical protein
MFFLMVSNLCLAPWLTSAQTQGKPEREGQLTLAVEGEHEPGTRIVGDHSHHYIPG